MGQEPIGNTRDMAETPRDREGGHEERGRQRGRKLLKILLSVLLTLAVADALIGFTSRATHRSRSVDSTDAAAYVTDAGRVGGVEGMDRRTVTITDPISWERYRSAAEIGLLPHYDWAFFLTGHRLLVRCGNLGSEAYGAQLTYPPLFPLFAVFSPDGGDTYRR